MLVVSKKFGGQNWSSVIITNLTIATAIFFAFPILLGFASILLPAAGYFPALNKTDFSTSAAVEFMNVPGFWPASWLSLKTGLLATSISLFCSFVILVVFFGSRMMAKIRYLFGPLIAIPHSTVAIGMVFLLAPTGLLVRLVPPSLSNFFQPVTWWLAPDPYGLTLILGLVAKELPFLLLLGLSASATLPVSRLLAIGAGLGYGRLANWIFLILPLIYRQIRLPVIAVLAFSLSVVDMALLLAPSLPPPLAILILNGFQSMDLAARIPASFGALWQIALVLLAILIWGIFERLIGRVIKFSQWHGWRAQWADYLLGLLSTISILPILIGILGILVAFIWAFSANWFFPQIFPENISFIHWQDPSNYLPLLINSGLLAASATLMAFAVVFLWLYDKHGIIQKNQLLQGAIYLPLFAPQISFLFGLQIGLSWGGFDGQWPTLIYVHMIFIIPYTWLILAPAFGQMDLRYDRIASSLGLSPIQRVLRVNLPLLAMPIGSAIFIGFAVSIALYLPTVFVGGGRIGTITVEAVSLATNGSRGPAGVAAILQVLIPLFCYGVVWTFIRCRFGKFSNMRGGAME